MNLAHPCRRYGPRYAPPSPEKSQKYSVVFVCVQQYWSGSPEKSESYQARIQCWAVFGTPAKRHLNGVSLSAEDGPLLVIHSSTKKKGCQNETPSEKTFWIRTCVMIAILYT